MCPGAQVSTLPKVLSPGKDGERTELALQAGSFTYDSLLFSVAPAGKKKVETGSSLISKS